MAQMKDIVATDEQARELAGRWAAERPGLDPAHVAMAVVARGMRAEGVAAIAAETPEQSELLGRAADAGLMEYIGQGQWVLTEAGR